MFFRTFGNRLRHAGMDFSNTIRSKLLPALAAFALFFVVSAAYFAPQFRGEALPQHDVIQYEGMAKDISDMRAATMPTHGLIPTISSMSHIETMAKNRNPAGVSMIFTTCPTVRFTSWAG